VITLVDPWGNVPRLPTLPGITVVEGDAFMIADPAGDVRPGTGDGLFHRDTRFLSGLRLEVDGRPPDLLASGTVDAFSARIYLRTAGEGAEGVPIVIERRRFIGDGVHEDLVVTNHGPEAAELKLQVQFEADFADLFEVKRLVARRSRPRISAAIDRLTGVVRLWRRGRRAERSVVIRVMPEADPVLTRESVAYRVKVPARQAWRTCIDIVPVHQDVAYEPRCRCDAFGLLRNPMAERARRWQAGFPVLDADDDTLVHTYRRTVADLGALRVSSPDGSHRVVVAAGMPWFMTLFGRDSLITAYMALPFAPELAVDSLEVLAAFQGRRVDRDSAEEPGKILHELRAGPLAVRRQFLGRVYYGTVDATLLFVTLVAEVHRWGVAPDAVERLVPAVERCLDWALTYGDADGDGFVEYQRQGRHGLANQAWKDSGDAIQSADGTLARGQIATVEVQGYLVDALRSGAEVLEAHGVASGRVADLRRRAAAIEAQIEAAFQVDTSLGGEDYLGLALDGRKRVVDALASNMGHLLWSRAVRPEVAERIARHLVAEPLFAGWGVRTLATTNTGFLPVSYHRGSIWPHDNALIAHGLARYGLTAPMARISTGLLRAAAAFDFALPELFAGLADDGHGFPVPYPAASRPQAWAAAAPLLLLRAWLGLEVDVPHGQVWISPSPPDGIDRLLLRGLAIGRARVDIGWSSGRLDVEGLPADLTVITERAPVGALAKSS
jgi:glycogen debranching enzyme